MVQVFTEKVAVDSYRKLSSFKELKCSHLAYEIHELDNTESVHAILIRFINIPC
jgi:hypothetical protein